VGLIGEADLGGQPGQVSNLPGLVDGGHEMAESQHPP
jgi:hypothetical protein